MISLLQFFHALIFVKGTSSVSNGIRQRASLFLAAKAIKLNFGIRGLGLCSRHWRCQSIHFIRMTTNLRLLKDTITKTRSKHYHGREMGTWWLGLAEIKPSESSPSIQYSSNEEFRILKGHNKKVCCGHFFPFQTAVTDAQYSGSRNLAPCSLNPHTVSGGSEKAQSSIGIYRCLIPTSCHNSMHGRY